MAENNKNATESRASDNVKASGLQTGETGAKTRKSFASGNPKIKSPKDRSRKNGKAGVWVDILVFFIIAALIAGISIGIAVAVRYYSTEYSDVTVSYSLLIENADQIAITDIINGTAVYARAEDGTSVRIGSVSGVEQFKNSDETVNLIVDVTTDAKFNPELGYYVNDVRIAIGARIDCRFTGYTAVCPVIRLE